MTLASAKQDPESVRRFALAEYATKPTKITLFLRTFLPWQIIRFLFINSKILKMTLHNGKIH